MSGSVNRVTILGRLGKDPEFQATQGGQSICKMSVATEEQWTDKGSGERQKRTEWHKIVCFGRTAEVAAEYLTKGRQVYLEGKIQTRSWDDKQTGEKRYMTEIVADHIVFIGGQGERSEQGQGRESPQGGGTRGAGQHRTETYSRGGQQGQGQGGYGTGQRQEAPPEDFGPGAGGEDDIPFARVPDIG